MLSWFLFALPLLWFAWLGYRNGIAHSLAALCGWLLAYPAMLFFTRPGAKWLQQHTPLEGLLTYSLASTLIFLATCFGCMALFRLAIGKFASPSIASRTAGLVLGAALGAATGLLLVYCLTLVRGLPQTPAFISQHPVSLLELRTQQWLGKASANLIGLGMKNKASGQLLHAFISDPHTTLSHSRALADNPDMQALLEEPQLQQLLQQGDVERLAAQPEFQRLLGNEHMRALLQQTGSEREAQEGAKQIAQLWSQLAQLRNDPQINAILNDPELQRQLQQGNSLQLMTNPQLEQLLARAIALSQSTQQPVYSWEDESGQIHYSDKPRPSH